jgi:GNAT superfamily N-acetyltransferase
VSHWATIWGVFVNPSYRGRGIAQTLLAAATAHATEVEHHPVDALCQCGKPVSEEALCAFQVFGVEPRAMKVEDRFYDEEHMFKTLV